MKKRSPELVEKFATRLVAITRNADTAEDIRDSVLNTFDMDEDDGIFEIADICKYPHSVYTFNDSLPTDRIETKLSHDY